MKNKVGQSCDSIFVGFCCSAVEPQIIGLCLNMIYRSSEKNFGYSSEFKIQHKRRGLATERACQSGTQS